MANGETRQSGEWNAVRAQWRLQEEQVRAPDDLVDRAFSEFDDAGGKSSKRAYMLGLSVAASLLLLAYTWKFVGVDRDWSQEAPLHTPATAESAPAMSEEGPCVEIGSCIDAQYALAVIDPETLLQLDAPQPGDDAYPVPGAGSY